MGRGPWWTGWIGPALLVLAAACVPLDTRLLPARAQEAEAPAEAPPEGSSAPEPTSEPLPPPAVADLPAPVLVVDDARTRNEALVPVELVAADGTPRTVALPPGFTIATVARGLSRPRFMAFDTAGNLLVASQAGSVYRYSFDAGWSPVDQPPPPLLDGLAAPSSVALEGGYLYVGETSQVSRFAYDPRGGVGPREVVVPHLPVGGHSTRTVVFGPDGMLYVSVGSSCNICDEADERRAAVLRFAPDGSGYERFAWGLRNAVGLAFQPVTGLLWATVNERDNQGNEIPPDLVTIVQGGQDFGWPRCQPPHGIPQEEGEDCSGVTPPTIGIQAHSAPLGLAFYSAAQFPPDFHGDLFVAQHGSWNRQPPAAPKLLRIRFEGDRPVGAEDFATGWQEANGRRWGRPAGVVVAPDGSLIVSDDAAGALYRVAYQP